MNCVSRIHSCHYLKKGYTKAAPLRLLIIKSDEFQGKWTVRFDIRRECRKEFTRCDEGIKEAGILFLGSLQMRLGPGPVFAYEWLTTTRWWQLYALRAGFIAAILIGMMIVWHNSDRKSVV